MRRTILFVVCLIIAGTFAFFGGYYVYMSNNPKTEIIVPESLQRTMPLSGSKEDVPAEYYIGKIEQNMLMIYKMPEKILYDSVETDDLQFYEDEEQKLLDGMVFQDLTEVFEFLENSMS